MVLQITASVSLTPKEKASFFESLYMRVLVCASTHTHYLATGLAARARRSSGSRELSSQLAMLGPFNIFLYLVQWTSLHLNTPLNTETDTDTCTHEHPSTNPSPLSSQCAPHLT